MLLLVVFVVVLFLMLSSLDATGWWSPTGQRGCMANRAGLLWLQSVMSLTSNWTNMNEGGEIAFFWHTVLSKFEQTLMLKDIVAYCKSLLQSACQDSSQRSDSNHCYLKCCLAHSNFIMKNSQPRWISSDGKFARWTASLLKLTMKMQSQV